MAQIGLITADKILFDHPDCYRDQRHPRSINSCAENKIFLSTSKFQK